ncbi:response regulator [Paenibacillus humicola]|uniref:response regulator n=1 Tax=Paenibacillus humicola TaxID=3110540 RepID=UPI00237AE9E0|nr:response regulator [Paenibacillus humicola]
MTSTFAIVDDDAVSRQMLQHIIEDSLLGDVVGAAAGGREGVRTILNRIPDIVLIDLLMPDQDGIETVAQLKENGFRGKFIMISQVENKEMVGQAYQTGIEFFIHKPINRVEVVSVLAKVNEQRRYERHLYEIKRALSAFGDAEQTPLPKARTVRDTVSPILMDLGILGENGSKEIVAIIEYLALRMEERTSDFPPLKELYEAAARKYKQSRGDIEKESKAIEQRIRRTVMAALTNLASIGLTDYSNPKFEHYAPLYFDFQDVRMKMRAMDEEPHPDKGKVNIKKFVQVLFLETLEKMRT